MRERSKAAAQRLPEEYWRTFHAWATKAIEEAHYKPTGLTEICTSLLVSTSDPRDCNHRRLTVSTLAPGSSPPPLFRIARIENLRIFVNVPQTFVRSIAPGQEARILVPEYPQRPFVGEIASTAGALDPTSRTLLTEVRLRNEDHALMPGMYAQVKFAVRPADAVWVIPATALIARAAGSQVLTVGGDGTVHYLGVQLGRDLGQSVEVISGLTGQERLVVSAPDGLKEGDRVAAAQSR